MDGGNGVYSTAMDSTDIIVMVTLTSKSHGDNIALVMVDGNDAVLYLTILLLEMLMSMMNQKKIVNTFALFYQTQKTGLRAGLYQTQLQSATHSQN